MTSWLIANMAWASLFMLIVLALRRPVARAFGAGSAYALWLLPALRLVMPPLPSLAPDIAAPLPVETLVVWAGDAAAPLPPAGGPAPWLPLLLAVWALGAAALLGWQWFAYRRFAGALRRSSRSLGAHRGLPVWESAAAAGPVALGLLDRRIVVPADFGTRYSAEERRLALDHEAVHLRRGDIWWNLAGLLILALNWFNPIAWLAFRAFRADQELACDAAVAAAASADARHDYARALVKSASRPGLIAACPLNHADQLKRRLKMMKHHRRSRGRMLGGAAIVLTLAGLSLAVGGPGFAQPDAPRQDQAQPQGERREEHRVIVRSDHDGPGAAEHRDHGEHREHSRRVIVMTHRGEGHGETDTGRDHAEHAEHMRHGDHMAMIADCRDGHSRIANVEDRDGERHTRFVFCGPNNMDPARRLHALERARALLAEESGLDAEGRARVLAGIDREIARLRGQ